MTKGFELYDPKRVTQNLITLKNGRFFDSYAEKILIDIEILGYSTKL